MSKKFVHGAVACLLLSGAGANAAQTHWEFQGRFTSVSGTEVPAGVAVGTPFRIVVGFDTAAMPATPTPGTAGGLRYDYSSPMRWQIYAGPECNPCEVSVPNGNIILRDNLSNDAAQPAVDGYSFGVIDDEGTPSTDDDTDLTLIMRGTTTDIVNGPGLAPEPDPRLADLDISSFEVCGPFNPPAGGPSRCSSIALNGEIDAVIRPAFGTGYIFTARDCRLQTNTGQRRIPNTDPPQFAPWDALPYDCVNSGPILGGVFVVGGSARQHRWSAPGGNSGNGGGVGAGAMSLAYTNVMSNDIDTSWNDGNAWHAAQVTYQGLDPAPVSLGSMFGSIGFGGPIALPVLKAYSRPSDVSRTNSNIYAYQKYNYSGGVTTLPLVLDLSYVIGNYSSPDDAGIQPNQPSERPGGAAMNATLSIVDAGQISLEQVGAVANVQGLNAIRCGNEPNLGWPQGVILGEAYVEDRANGGGLRNVAESRPIVSCSSPPDSPQPVELAAGQDFFITAGMQIPARGKARQPGDPSLAAIAENGFVHADSTFLVAFDPAVPAADVQTFVSSVAPGCAPNCDFTSIDIKPGDASNCINPRARGVIPVAIFGSNGLQVRDINRGSLRLGALQPATTKNRAQCSVKNLNGDDHDDLVCQFANDATNWRADQASETLIGEAATGPFEASDKVCIEQ